MTLSTSTNKPTTPPPLTLVPTTFHHGPEGCGERIESPHPRCQELFLPYLAGERLHRRFATIVLCLVCRSAWREVAEPYDLDDGALGDLDHLARHGFDVRVSAHRARHFPGQTIAIEIIETRP